MAIMDIVLVALGGGDRLKGARLAAMAFVLSLPVYLGLATALALGPGR